MSTNDKRTVSLVLGSGGARGLAHIGVIHWLEENKFKVESISGCSIGALIGGVYAARKLDDFEQWVRAIKKVDIMTLLDLSWEKSGLVKGDKIINTLIDLVGDLLIEDLPISYTAIATDINSEKEIWINSGRLFDAIRASISLPLFFTPYDYKGITLIDGGVLNPVPIAPTFLDNTDMTIAVNLGGKIAIIEEQDKAQTVPDASSLPFQEKVSLFIERFQRSIKNIGKLDLGVYDIANQAFDAMQSTIARQKLASYPPDYIIEIPRNTCGILEFDRASEIISLGYKRAQECMGQVVKGNRN
ncbi:MAG: patatin-like phospholipase family protein [Deltaproteobacteria bacterium]|nr:patatin-like phospholipase family protein [Deltaproteobacteria bacterium]